MTNKISSFDNVSSALDGFQDRLASYERELQLPHFQVRLFSKWAESYDKNQTFQNNRIEFVGRVGERIQYLHSKFSRQGEPFDLDGTHYRVIRTFDEVFKQRPFFHSLIDHWYDKGKLPAIDALILIDLIEKALSSDHTDTSGGEELISSFEKESMNTLAVNFAERLVSLKQQKGIPISRNSIELFTQLFNLQETIDVGNKREVFQYFLRNYFRCRKETNALLRSAHSISLEPKQDSASFPVEQSSSAEKNHLSPRVPRWVIEAEFYWLTRIYDETYDLRSFFATWIDKLYDREELNMSTAIKIIALAESLEEESRLAPSEIDMSFRFRQSLLSIQNPLIPGVIEKSEFDQNRFFSHERYNFSDKLKLPDKISETAFEQILNVFNAHDKRLRAALKAQREQQKKSQVDSSSS